VQTEVKKENELASSEKPRMRLGGHNMGPAPQLLGAAMNAMKGAIEDYARKCDLQSAWWTSEGEELSIKRNVFDNFDAHCLCTIGLHRVSWRTLSPTQTSARLRLRLPRTSLRPLNTSAPASI
jgi:hypothetical protein